MKKLIIIGILFLISALLYSQQLNIDLAKQNERQLAAQLESLQIEKTRYLHQSDSLAALIQQLKSKQDLNIFQRRRLEQLLKSSQELDQNILAVDQKIEKADREYQAVLRELVAWYDAQMAQLIDSGRGKKISQEQLERLATWQRERQEYASKIKQDQLQHLISSRPIQIQESDSYQIIKQKADLVKDQEDKARKQIMLVDKRVTELQKELKLRSRMNELIADTYLMDQPPEKMLPQSQVRGTNENATFSETDKSMRAQSSASFDVVDNLLLKTDVSGISKMDLESQLRNLQQMKARLTQTADSLGAVAEKFYQAAEQKRRDEQKN
ncbi:MAG: hypothetical protein ONB37_18860 [candidate division KSB1 bacterium]|nr:hypothetical protein [candidate division KSB1 bacterium]